MTGNAPGRPRFSRWQLLAAIGSVLALVAALITGLRLFSGWGPAPAASAGSPVPVHTVHGRTVKIPPMHPYRRPPVSWPARQTGVARIAVATGLARRPVMLTAGPSAGSARAGSLPVWVGPPDAGGGTAVTSAFLPSAGVSRVQVAMAPHATAAALGVRGAVFAVSRDDGSAASGQVHVSVDYSSFARAYGGEYAARLRLVELPACALTTPQVPACRRQTPVPAGSADNVRTRHVGADVILPGLSAADTVLTAKLTTAGSQAVVLAATAAPAGSAGNFAALPLSEANEWVNGGSSGAYSYTYPVTVPPVPGGLEPTVAVKYSSQATDGLTSSTNNETSWIGDGWDYSPGFIQAEYPVCSSINTLGFPQTSDLCEPTAQHWLTMSLNGTDTTLVNYKTSSSAGWQPEAANGTGVTEVTQTVGAVTLPKYWKVAEPDGTTYWFGLNQLPGYSSGDPVTNSDWTVPVYDKVNTQAPYVSEVWRWNLDYVTDLHGDAIAYFYNTQTNNYAEDNGTTATGQYIQGGVLSKIEYGLRDGSAYTTTPAAQVTFTTSSTRQDAPDDLACASGASCSVTAPTFWTDYALTGISTQSLNGSSLQNADSWAFADSYPATGDSTTSPSLWLSAITHTGQDGATPLTLPPTSFAGTPGPNRVQTAADTAAGYSLITRFRLTSITNQTGGVTTIAYNGEDAACAAGNFPAVLSSNTTACYPDFWTATGSTTKVEDWFNLYDVKSATITDTTGGDPPVVTSYSYAGPAWHFDDDTVSRSATTTWDQWRGFRTVTTQTGTAPDPVTETADTYLQGMSSDENPGGCMTFGCNTSNVVTVTDTHGDKVTDSDQYAAMLLESIVYNGAGTGNQVTDTISLPGTINDFGADTTTSVHAVQAGGAETITYTALAGGGTRESTITYAYDGDGNVVKDVDVPDTADPTQTTCTVSAYGDNAVGVSTRPPARNLPIEVTVLAAGTAQTPCAVSRTAPESTLVSDTAYTYNSAGDVTKTQKATAASYSSLSVSPDDLPLSFTYIPAQTATYDEYGRALTSADADNRTTATAYTPATGAEQTSVQVTDPAGLITTTSYDPARDLPLTVTDPASYQTTKAYDALGRVTSVWTPGNPATGPAVNKYSYTDSNTTPSFSTEQVEEPGGNYLATKTFDDSLGQVREIQQESANGGSDISDTNYNSDGLKALTSDPYYVSGAPSGTLIAAASTSVPSQTGYVYDGAGRVLKQIAYADGTETWETDTTYGGNYTTVIPPSGGTSQTTFTDGRGLTVAIYQYHAGATPSPSDPASEYDKTSYTYTPAQKLAAITDAVGNTWTYTYDLLGNQLTQADPDAGKFTSSYDNASQLMSVTDARSKTISYTYDGEGRKTAEYNTTGGALESTADELASWTWDTLAKGQIASSTAYEDGESYTEQVTGYDSNGHPSGTEVVIPSVQSLGALSGTYTTSYTYAPTGQVISYTDSAAGGLPQETVTAGYNAAGNPLSLTGASPYVDSLSYTNLDQPLRYTLGTSGEPADITDSYDAQTSRLTEQNIQTTTAQTSVDDLHYSYDQVGNVTSEADVPSGASAATDVQCFQYNYLGRLVQAWAQGSAGCAAVPSASAEGGAAPYWNAYSYDVTGNLTGFTSTSPAGVATTTSNSYPAATQAQPHTITTSKVIAPSGTTTSSYTYDASGNLAAVASPAQNQTLTWTDNGQLAQDAITPNGGTAHDASYTYDADGTLLITTDPSTTTLYLPDEELSLSSGTVTGTRYYTINGQTIATRTGASSVAYLAGDQQNTSSVAIDAATLDITRRYYDPYGNPRGPVPSSFPAGEKGFVGGATDTGTGLTDLGAREYRPATGSFITPDPVLKPYDPTDLNPYAYAQGNPSTYADPSGAMLPGGGECGVGSSPPCQPQNPPKSSNNPRGSTSCTPAASFGKNGPVDGPICSNVAGGTGNLWDWLKKHWKLLTSAGLVALAMACGVATAEEDESSICGKLRGSPAKGGSLTVVGSGFSASEKAAAEWLASLGRKVVLREATGGTRTSDLIVDGVPYDVYTPKAGTSIRNILSKSASKWSQVRGGGVVIDLANTKLTSADFGGEGRALAHVNSFIKSWPKGIPISDLLFFNSRIMEVTGPVEM